MYFNKTHVAEAGGVIETEYFETFFSEFLNDSRQLVASSSLVLENIIGTSTPLWETLRLSEKKLTRKQNLLFTRGILIQFT